MEDRSFTYFVEFTKIDPVLMNTAIFYVVRDLHASKSQTSNVVTTRRRVVLEPKMEIDIKPQAPQEKVLPHYFYSELALTWLK